MNDSRLASDGLGLAYRDAKHFSFAAGISIVLMFVSLHRRFSMFGRRKTGQTYRGQCSSNHTITEGSQWLPHILDPRWQSDDLLTSRPTAKYSCDVRQLAHDQEVLGAHRLHGERHSYENPRRCLARGSGMEEGARWAGVNQC